jgi:hypothetical protein
MLDLFNSIKALVIYGYMKDINKLICILGNSELFIKVVICMKEILLMVSNMDMVHITIQMILMVKDMKDNSKMIILMDMEYITVNMILVD